MLARSAPSRLRTMSSMQVTLHPRVRHVQRLRGGRVSGSDRRLRDQFRRRSVATERCDRVPVRPRDPDMPLASRAASPTRAAGVWRGAIRRIRMQRQLIVSIALLCATLSATTSSSQSPLDHVLDTLRDLRAARGSNAKIQSQLLPPRTAGPAAGGPVAAPPLPTADGRLHVYLDCSPLGANELSKLRQAGARIERIQMARGLVQAWVDPSALDTLAAFPWVRAIRSVDRAVVRTGGITTEGDVASRADELRATRGVDGTGVVVGVISDGIDSLADAQATRDLPDVVVPNDSRCQRGAGDEGTALLEIVHDVAPGAKLLFSGPSTSLDMVDAVQCLVDAGANVIVDDLGFFGEPYFEDGPVADAVSAAVTAGVSYHSSAGNEAQAHVEEEFFPAPGSNGQIHDWAAGAGDAFNGVVVPARGTLTCILQWNDPF